ncbi:MAG: diguanylate cyclase domain-containing protein, partial [Geminicoccales bacterium]
MTQAASLVVPALLLSIATGLSMVPALPDWLATAVQAAPLVVFGGSAALGILMQRGRIVLGIVVLALADVALAHFGDRAVFNAIGLLLPLNLGVIVWLGEANLVTAQGALRLGVIMAQAAIVATLRHPELAALAELLGAPLLTVNLEALTALPHAVLVALAGGLGLVLARLLVNGRSLPAGVAWALIASFLALDRAGAGRPASVYFVAAGLILVVGAVLEPSRVTYRDDTTGLPGRLALNEALRRLHRRYALAWRYAVAGVEIDDFRRFREEHGADAARRMLRRVAECLQKVGGGGRAFYCEGST